MFHSTLSRTWLCTAVTTACLAGYPHANAEAIAPHAAAASAPSPASAPVKEKRTAPANANAPLDFPAIVERYGPAVVNIRAILPEKPLAAPTPPAPAAAPAAASGASSEAIDGDDPLFAFFRQAMPQLQDGQSSSPRAMSGVGSGFIVSPNGLILTTAHVVDGSDDVTVRLTDRREFKAKVVAVDGPSDVAVIQIEATKLPVVKLGDSTRVRVGEQVLTIGSPDSYQNTVTAGIVSATSRTLSDGTTFPFFQTNGALNPDNSGGPVFNRAGEVVGIHVQVYADGDRFQSLTFAIPIAMANKVRAQLQAQSKSQDADGAHGAFGMQVQDVDPGLAGAFGLPRAAGALVIAVEPGSPAATSKLKPGDVIVQIADKPVEHAADLADPDALPQTGSKVPVKLIRNRKQVTIMVNLAASAQYASTGVSDVGPLDHLGLSMHPLTDDERRTTGLAEGLMVEDVSGAAGPAGIKPGDVVLSLNGTLVASQDELAALAAKAGKKAALLIQRNHARSFVTVDLK
ncbi:MULTISPECIES: trypsin-like peptidase domain-containing protein [Paraburkholderia]|uniref:trypsin-like peptidase domain-containing protein n=1 Tax=Paraburkholderia TaxID=1822464 RepID=UPI0006D41AA3|nr:MULTISPECIES: trypsin-like peptidase domain-containing protein [Paraburkholderia]ALP67320.1 signaling protein [Paraburkholderia caribensis]AUT57038.1 signaling protein [Paraburkholderia caribensis]